MQDFLALKYDVPVALSRLFIRVGVIDVVDLPGITAAPVYLPTIDKTVVKGRSCSNTDDATYQGWYDEVYVPTGVAESITIEGDGTVGIGDTITLTATTYPAGQEVTWESLDEDNATITSGGVVTGVASGTATIRATLTGMSVSATKNIIVTAG